MRLELVCLEDRRRLVCLRIDCEIGVKVARLAVSVACRNWGTAPPIGAAAAAGKRRLKGMEAQGQGQGGQGGNGGQGHAQQQQQQVAEEEHEKRVALDYDQRVRLEAILGCQHIKEVEQQLVRAPPPLLGNASHPEAQAVRAGIMTAAAAIVRSFSNVIQLLSTFPPGNNNNSNATAAAAAAMAAVAAIPPMLSLPASPLEQQQQQQQQQQHHRGLMNAIAQLEAGRNRSHSPNNPESPMSTAGNSEITPPPSPTRMLSPRMGGAGSSVSPRLPPLPSPPLSSSPCHTPMSGMSDGSPVSNFQNLSTLGILDMEATSRQASNAIDTDADTGAGGADQRPVPKRRKFLPRWNIKLRATGGESGNEAPPDDGFTWRKYGQKDILGSRFPRSYYRCTHKNELGCPAIKYVQRCDDDPGIFDVTYRGEHSCLAQMPPNPWFPFSGVPSPMHNLAQQPFPPATDPAATLAGAGPSSSSIILNNSGGIQVGPSLPPLAGGSGMMDTSSPGVPPARVPFHLTTPGNAAGSSSNLLLRPSVFAQGPVITPRFGMMPFLDPRAGVKSEQQQQQQQPPFPSQPPPTAAVGHDSSRGTGSVFPPNAVSLLSMLLQNAVKSKEHQQQQHQPQGPSSSNTNSHNPTMMEPERDSNAHQQQGLTSHGFAGDLSAALPRAGSMAMDNRGAYVSNWVDSLPPEGYIHHAKDEADEMTVESSAESLPSPASSDAVSSVFRAPRANTAGLTVVAPPRNPRAALQQQQARQQQSQVQPGQQQQPAAPQSQPGQAQAGVENNNAGIPFSIGLYLDSPGSQQQFANAMNEYESYGNSMLFGAPPG